MTNIELLALLDRTRKEIKMNRFECGSVPASLQTLVKEIERELLVRGYDVDYSSVPAWVLVDAMQDECHIKHPGKARAGRSVKISKI